MVPDIVTLLIPIILILAIFSYSLAGRVLAHRERMAMIDKGVQPADVPVGATSRGGQLRGALTTTAVGLALVIGLGTLGFGPWLLGGLIPLFIGVTQLIVYVASGDDTNRAREKSEDD